MITELELGFPGQGFEWFREGVLRHCPCSLRCRVGNDDAECADREERYHNGDGHLDDEFALHDSTPTSTEHTLCCVRIARSMQFRL